MISSHPYNPKAQGKIERSPRELQKKLHYNMVKLKKQMCQLGRKLTQLRASFKWIGIRRTWVAKSF